MPQLNMLDQAYGAPAGVRVTAHSNPLIPDEPITVTVDELWRPGWSQSHGSAWDGVMLDCLPSCFAAIAEAYLWGEGPLAVATVARRQLVAAQKHQLKFSRRGER